MGIPARGGGAGSEMELSGISVPQWSCWSDPPLPGGAPKARELGWAPRAGDSSGTKLLRQTLAGLLSPGPRGAGMEGRR